VTARRKIATPGSYARRCKVLMLHPRNPWTTWAIVQGLHLDRKLYLVTGQ